MQRQEILRGCRHRPVVCPAPYRQDSVHRLSGRCRVWLPQAAAYRSDLPHPRLPGRQQSCPVPAACPHRHRQFHRGQQPLQRRPPLLLRQPLRPAPRRQRHRGRPQLPGTHRQSGAGPIIPDRVLVPMISDRCRCRPRSPETLSSLAQDCGLNRVLMFGLIR